MTLDLSILGRVLRLARKASVFAIGLTSLCLIACSDVEFTTPPKSDNVKSFSSKHFAAEIIAKDAINSYEIHFKFTDLGTDTWFLKKSGTDAGHELVFPIGEREKQNGFADSEVTPANSYTYTLSPTANVLSPSTPPLTIEIPEDLDVKALLKRVAASPDSHIKGFRRLFLDSAEPFTTSGRELTIEVDEIRSSNGSIQTFPENQTAPLGTNGHSGGSLTIRAKRVLGTLNIVMRGERGGQGQQGLSGSGGALGAVGPTERTGSPWMQPFCRGVPRYTGDEFVRRHPARGGVGGQGGTGHAGFPGMQGGFTGNLVVEIPGVDESQIHFIVQPGLAGEGGNGGLGGDGGPGGPGGAIQGNHDCDGGRSLCCPPSPQGATGPRGEQGPKGPPGTNGDRGTVVINGKLKSILL